jgi:hypothetical protein
VTDNYIYNLFQSVVVGPSGTTPVWGAGVAVTVNLIALTSSKNAGTIVINWWGDDGVTHTASVVPGAPVLIKRQSLRETWITGTAGDVITIVLSWPEETDPSSLVVAAPVTVEGSGQTPLIQDSSGNLIEKIAGNQTYYEMVNESGTIAANSAGETYFVQGNILIPKGARVDYSLSVVGSPGTAGNGYAIWISEKSSGYVCAMCGQGAIAGVFYMHQSDYLNLIGINQDTVAHYYTGTWIATSP